MIGVGEVVGPTGVGTGEGELSPGDEAVPSGNNDKRGTVSGRN